MKPAKEKKAKEKDRKHSKKRKREESGVDGLKLSVLTQLGDVAKVERYLAKQGDSSINNFDAEGFTPLHQVNDEAVPQQGMSALSPFYLQVSWTHACALCRHAVMATMR